MAVLFENISLLVLGTEDEDTALEEIANLLPRFVLAQVKESTASGEDTTLAQEFSLTHDFGYIGPFAENDLAKNIIEGVRHFSAKL